MSAKKLTGNKIKAKYVISKVHCKDDQIGTIRALGFKKLNQVREFEDNSVNRGMLFKVKHLLEIIS